MKFTKKCFFLLLIFARINNSCAGDITVKLNGGFDFQAGHLKSNAPAKAKPVSTNNKNFAFNSSAYAAVNAKNTLDSGFIYGAQIAISPTTTHSRKTRSMLFMEASFGRLELGSEQSAVSKMRITPLSIASATGGLWDIWVAGDPVGNIPYNMNYSNYLDSKMRARGKTEFSRKITYFTPKYNGLQFGISYIPDSGNVGYDELKENVAHTPITSNYTYAVKNGFGGGVSYQKDFNDISYVKLSGVTEFGKVIATPKPNVKVPTIKPKRLATYHVGAEFTHSQYSIAGSYANHLGSFIAPNENRVETAVYGLGGRYKLEKFSSSVTYFSSTHRKNKMEAITFAVDYKVAKGLLPYAEVTLFRAKGSDILNPKIRSNHKGSLLLTGARVEF